MRDMERKFKRDIEDILGTFAKNFPGTQLPMLSVMLGVIYLVVVRERLASVKNKVLVLSGKGGLGKSTVSAMLGLTLALDDSKEVGFLDIDICGPSQPRVLGTAEEKVHSSGAGWSPVLCTRNAVSCVVDEDLGTRHPT
ncbi:hypothetical protein O3P69_014552 [Scylla paramamosain]|uniref:Uncharacterized protein n=1 Tax=Scylla paramamosain TaxID=85552 RepID=A0AAW0SCS1_SCYPA